MLAVEYLPSPPNSNLKGREAKNQIGMREKVSKSFISRNHARPTPHQRNKFTHFCSDLKKKIITKSDPTGFLYFLSFPFSISIVKQQKSVETLCQVSQLFNFLSKNRLPPSGARFPRVAHLQNPPPPIPAWRSVTWYSSWFRSRDSELSSNAEILMATV